MNKKVLGVAMVLVFCITWWIVAGEAWQAMERSRHSLNQAEQASKQTTQDCLVHAQVYEQAVKGSKDLSEAHRRATGNYWSCESDLYESKRWRPNPEMATKNGGKNLYTSGYDRNQPRPSPECQSEWEVLEKARKLWEPYESALKTTERANLEAKSADKNAQESLEQAELTSAIVDEHFRTQASWGIGAGLLADVLLLVGALAWSKLTTKA